MTAELLRGLISGWDESGLAMAACEYAGLPGVPIVKTTSPSCTTAMPVVPPPMSTIAPLRMPKMAFAALGSSVRPLHSKPGQQSIPSSRPC